MKINFLHICDSAFFSDEKKLNIIGIFEVLNSTNFPVAHPSFSIVLNISDYSDLNVSQLIIINPQDEKPLLTIQIEKKSIMEGKTNVNLVFNLIGVVFPVPGKYKIAIKMDGDEISTERNDFIIVNKI